MPVIRILSLFLVDTHVSLNFCTTWQARALIFLLFVCLLYLRDGLAEGCPVENLLLCQGQFLPVALLLLAELQDLGAVFLESEKRNSIILCPLSIYSNHLNTR